MQGLSCAGVVRFEALVEQTLIRAGRKYEPRLAEGRRFDAAVVPGVSVEISGFVVEPGGARDFRKLFRVGDLAEFSPSSRALGKIVSITEQAVLIESDPGSRLASKNRLSLHSFVECNHRTDRFGFVPRNGPKHHS